MKKQVKVRLSLVDWNLLPTKDVFDFPEQGIYRKTMSFLCITIYITKTQEKFAKPDND